MLDVRRATGERVRMLRKAKTQAKKGPSTAKKRPSRTNERARSVSAPKQPAGVKGRRAAKRVLATKEADAATTRRAPAKRVLATKEAAGDETRRAPTKRVLATKESAGTTKRRAPAERVLATKEAAADRTRRGPTNRVVATKEAAGATARRAPARRVVAMKESAGDEARRASARGAKAAKAAQKPVLLSGGNPQIAKGDGEAPVRAYLEGMPGWKADVGRRLDALITRTVPKVKKAVKWNSPFYGVDGRGWFMSFHCFTKYVKVTFFRGASLQPIPPGESKHPEVRYLDIYETDQPSDAQLTRWIRQAAKLPGWNP